MSLLTQLKIDRSAAATIGDQIVAHFEAAAKEGRIPFGTRLPSIRDLAEQLGVSRNSAVHAYEILVDRGVIESRLGTGFFMNLRPQPVLSSPSRRFRPSQVPQSPSRFQSQGAQEPAVEADEFRLAPLSAPSSFEDFVMAHAPRVESFSHDLAATEDLKVAIRHAAARAERILLEETPEACWRGPRELLGAVSHDLALHGIPVGPGTGTVLVNSLHEALGLVFDALEIQKGDRVLVEDPAPLAVRSVVLARGLSPVTLPRTSEFLDLSSAAASELQNRGVRAIVTMPNFQDPTGGVLSPHERTQLLALATELGVPVIEIDEFPGLCFGEVFQTSMAALDGLARTIHISAVGSLFSSTFQHQVICARSEYVGRLVRCRALSHGRTAFWEQAVLEDLWMRGCQRKQVLRLQRVLRERRDLLIGMLRRLDPTGVRWVAPMGGISLWLERSGEFQAPHAERVPPQLLGEGCIFAPADVFRFSNDGSPAVRLNFARFDPAESYAQLKALFEHWGSSSVPKRSREGAGQGAGSR